MSVHTRLLLPPFFFLLATGCPDAPSDLEGGGAPGNPTPNAGDAPDGMMGPPPNMAKDEPGISQESLAEDPDAVTLSGTLVCESGDGPFRIRLFVPPPEEGGPTDEEADASPPGPLVLIELEAPGEFSLKAPKSPALKLLAYLDADKSGAPTPDEAQFSTEDGKALNLTESISGLLLDCSTAPRCRRSSPPRGCSSRGSSSYRRYPRNSRNRGTTSRRPNTRPWRWRPRKSTAWGRIELQNLRFRSDGFLGPPPVQRTQSARSPYEHAGIPKSGQQFP